MADCDDVLHDLFTYLDRELTVQMRDQIKSHLTDCPECYEAIDFHAELRQVIAKRCRDEMPPGLADRIRSCFGDDVLQNPMRGPLGTPNPILPPSDGRRYL